MLSQTKAGRTRPSALPSRPPSRATVSPDADTPKKNDGAVQLDLFTDYAAEEEKQKAEDAALERERKIQAATPAIKKKYGKNAILKAMNLEEGATAKDRNAQIGGHKA